MTPLTLHGFGGTVGRSRGRLAARGTGNRPGAGLPAGQTGPAHHEGAYDYLMSDVDREMMPLLKEFSGYDLYSKADDPPDIDALAPYYQNLIKTWFPAEIAW